MTVKNLNKEKNFISIVAYVKNAENNIQSFMKNIDALLRDKFEAYEFVLVNDNSSDASKKKIEEIADDLNGNVILIDMAWSHQIETSMLAGVDIAIGDFVFEFDTTLIDYDVNLIWETYTTAMKGYDIVSVSPDNKVKLTSKLFYKYLNRVSFRNLELTTETFRLVSRRALNRILRTKEKMRYRKALYKYSGFEQTSLFYKSNIHSSGKISGDNLSTIEKVSLASDVLISFSNVGLRFALGLSLMFFSFSVMVIIYTISSYIRLQEIAEGWTTMMLFMSASFSGLFFVLAFMSKYMATILVELKERPTYVYKSVNRLSKK